MGGLRLGYPNIILVMSPDHLRATCVALLGTLLAPLAFVPLVIGIAITWVPMSVILVVDAIAMAGAVLAASVVRDPRNDPDGACIS